MRVRSIFELTNARVIFRRVFGVFILKLVRMVLYRNLTIGFFNIVRACVWLYAQLLIMILCHYKLSPNLIPLFYLLRSLNFVKFM